MRNNLLVRFRVFIIAFWSIFSAHAQITDTAPIHFFQNDVAAAQKLAAQSEKLILVKFHAKWCLPCRVMDEYVWTDPSLATMVGDNCVAVSVDIENFDGLALKQQYLVESLPTILLLDACGKVLVRFETSCSASVLLERLQFFNTPENRFCPADPLNVAPIILAKTELDAIAPTDATATHEPLFLSKPVRRDMIDLTEVVKPAYESSSAASSAPLEELPEH